MTLLKFTQAFICLKIRQQGANPNWYSTKEITKKANELLANPTRRAELEALFADFLKEEQS